MNSNSAQVSVNLKNTSTIGRITSFGLSVDNFTGFGTGTLGSDLTSFKSTNFSGFAAVDVCATSGSNCAGGGNGGIVVNDSDFFTFALNGTFNGLLNLDRSCLKTHFDQENRALR
ncbi:MAG: hypothetical protein FJ147_28275 [Deltaproteobacteria bacterium]|nr:hypothetical protein [Deltaproteobacteria bacterium]